MTQPQRQPRQTARPPGVIEPTGIYTLAEVMKRLNWGQKTARQAQRDGLRTVLYGRVKYVTGEAVVDFFKRLEEANTNV
jgi:hypothetical protein